MKQLINKAHTKIGMHFIKLLTSFQQAQLECQRQHVTLWKLTWVINTQNTIEREALKGSSQQPYLL